MSLKEAPSPQPRLTWHDELFRILWAGTDGPRGPTRRQSFPGGRAPRPAAPGSHRHSWMNWEEGGRQLDTEPRPSSGFAAQIMEQGGDRLERPARLGALGWLVSGAPGNRDEVFSHKP